MALISLSIFTWKMGLMIQSTSKCYDEIKRVKARRAHRTESETQQALHKFYCCSFLVGLSALSFLPLHFKFPKYRGKNTSNYLSPSPQHGAQQKLGASSTVVEVVESFTFLWHSDTVQNWFLGTIWLHIRHFQTKFCLLLER